MWSNNSWTIPGCGRAKWDLPPLTGPPQPESLKLPTFVKYFSIKINDATINPSPHARVLGVILDSDLSFQPQIQLLSKACRLYLCNISKMFPFLPNETTELFIHFLVISHLNYCNSLLIGLPLQRLSPPQSIRNTAPRLIYRTNCSVSATSFCQSFHWLPIAQWIKFKILTKTYTTI